MSKFIPKSSGLSLVELMIAAMLGMVLLAGVISLFIGSKQSYRVQDQLSNVQTDGRFAMMFMERFVENAGWYEELAPSIPSAIETLQTSDGGGVASDSIAVQVEVPAGTEVDCNGSVAVGTTLINRFYVNGTTLLCQGNGGSAAQPIVENVESFQVLYGVDTDADGVVNQYVTATSIGAATNVIAVQIALLMATNDNVASESKSESFNVLDVSINTDDSRLRRVFQKTIMLPNQAYVLMNNG